MPALPLLPPGLPGVHNIIVYVDDAAYAQQLLAPLHPGRGALHQTRWIVVACAPRMTHRISKWVSHGARENWRNKWAEKLFAQVVPWLQSRSAGVSTVLARGPVAELTNQLLADLGSTAQVLDARRPKVEHTTPEVRHGWSLPGTLGSLVTGFGALLALAGE